MNYLEQLVSEWYNYNGYFVRTNIRVGKTNKDKGELDVLAYSPVRNEIIHIETSTDSYRIGKTDEKYKSKFEKGKKHYKEFFVGIDTTEIKFEQYAIFLHGSTKKIKKVAGKDLKLLSDLLLEIENDLKQKSTKNKIVHENFPIIRTIQLLMHQPQTQKL